MTDAAASTTTTTPTPTVTTETQTWWSGYDDETKGYVQNKGLSTKPVNEAFLQASKFHREAEKLIGAPANEIVRLPKDPASPDWTAVWKRLGAAAAAEDYKFEGVKREGDKALDPSLVDTLRKASFEAHLSPDNANAFAKQVVTHLDKIESGRIAEQQATLETEQKALKDNWGAKFVANSVIAASAATALGVSKDELEALGNTRGYAKVMEMFRNIGTKIGEDRFVLSQSGSGNVMTKEQANAEKSALKADTAWVKRFLQGGVEEKRKMEALDKIIVGIA